MNNAENRMRNQELRGNFKNIVFNLLTVFLHQDSNYM